MDVGKTNNINDSLGSVGREHAECKLSVSLEQANYLKFRIVPEAKLLLNIY